MSRFAAVPTAALDDDRLEALHIRVLTALCSYADKDGWCRVGQDQIAKRARTNPARVSQCISDLVSWGWLRRQRVGKMKVNVYQVLMDCEYDASINLPSEQEGLAETANHVTCSVGKSELPREQITLAETANPIGTPFSNTVSNTVLERASAPPPEPEQPKRKPSPRGSARGSRIPPNWAPTPKDYAFASSEGLSREEINREADRFRDYWTAASGRNACKLDWEATWRNWLRSDFRKPSKSAVATTVNAPRGAFDRVISRLDEGAPSAPEPGRADLRTFDGSTIDGEYRAVSQGFATGPDWLGGGSDQEDAGALFSQRRAGHRG